MYHLTVAKGGPRMQPGGAQPPTQDELKTFGTDPVPALHQRGDGSRGYEFLGHSCTMAALTRQLSGMMGKEVVDQTGLANTYDFDLQYSDSSEARREQDPNLWPPMTEAVEQQLGLKLIPGQGAVRILVVDRVDPPTSN